MKILNVVFAAACLSAFVPSEPVWAGDGVDAGVATDALTRGGKSSRGHAQARETRAAADRAEELREAKRAEAAARKAAAGEKPVATTPVVTAPIKVPAGGGGKSSKAHARAKAVREAADQAAARDEE